jgi:hypothetical protein
LRLGDEHDVRDVDLLHPLLLRLELPLVLRGGVTLLREAHLVLPVGVRQLEDTVLVRGHVVAAARLDVLDLDLDTGIPFLGSTTLP